MPVFTNEETKRANKSLSQSCELNTIKEAWEPKTMSSAMLAPSPKPGPPPVSHLCERPTTQQWLKPQALAPPTSMPRFSTLWLKSSPGDLWTLPSFTLHGYQTCSRRLLLQGGPDNILPGLLVSTPAPSHPLSIQLMCHCVISLFSPSKVSLYCLGLMSWWNIPVVRVRASEA